MLFICELIICFFIFSFLGWCLEVVYTRFILKRFVNRGFLIGPLCPIYGCGCVLLFLLLKKYQDDPIMLFLAAMTICSLLEYFASYIMEKIFKTRWWDYSEKKFNIAGRICLEMAVPFGMLGMLVVYVLFPFTLDVLSNLSNIYIYIISGILLILFTIDLCISFNIVMKFTKVALSVPKDMTEEITKFVNETLKKNKLAKRILDSFPNFKINRDAIRKKLKKIQKKISN